GLCGADEKNPGQSAAPGSQSGLTSKSGEPRDWAGVGDTGMPRIRYLAVCQRIALPDLPILAEEPGFRDLFTRHLQDRPISQARKQQVVDGVFLLVEGVAAVDHKITIHRDGQWVGLN